jgi:hypothetical protein
VLTPDRLTVAVVGRLPLRVRHQVEESVRAF